MSYTDEEILKGKKAIQQQQKEAMEKVKEEAETEASASITDDEITLFGQSVHYERVSIPELKISLLMPESFFRLADDMVQIIYPAGNRPSHVYSGENIIYQVSFTKTVNQVPNDGIPKFLPMARKLMEKMGPKTRILNADTIAHSFMLGEEEKTYNIGIIEFISAAVDMNIYNVMFFFSIENQLMIGNIVTQNKYKNRIAQIAKETIDSLEIYEEEENTDGNNNVSES